LDSFEKIWRKTERNYHWADIESAPTGNKFCVSKKLRLPNAVRTRDLMHRTLSCGANARFWEMHVHLVRLYRISRDIREGFAEIPREVVAPQAGQLLGVA